MAARMTIWYMGGTTKADMYCHSWYDSTASSFRLSAWPGQRHNPGEQDKDVSDLGRRDGRVHSSGGCAQPNISSESTGTQVRSRDPARRGSSRTWHNIGATKCAYFCFGALFIADIQRYRKQSMFFLGFFRNQPTHAIKDAPKAFACAVIETQRKLRITAHNIRPKCKKEIGRKN